MNNSTPAPVTTPNLPQHIQFVCIGGLTVIMNLIVMYTLSRDVRVLKKYAFLAGLTVGDFLFGVAILGFGTTRIYRTVNNIPDELVHPSYCMQVLGLTTVILLGNQIPGVMFAIMGVERLLAVRFYDWYYLKWTTRLAWKCVCFVYFYCICSLLLAFLTVNLMSPDALISISCATPTAMGKSYITYHYCVSIVGGTLAVLATVAAMISFTQRKMRLEANNTVANGIRTYVKKQWNASLILLFIAVLDFGMVVLPNILLLLSVYSVTSIANLATISLMTSCARSIPNIFIYALVNDDFRLAVRKAFKLDTGNAAVVPIFNSQPMVPVGQQVASKL